MAEIFELPEADAAMGYFSPRTAPTGGVQKLTPGEVGRKQLVGNPSPWTVNITRFWNSLPALSHVLITMLWNPFLMFGLISDMPAWLSGPSSILRSLS